MSNDKIPQLEADKQFIKIADSFINQANSECEESEHRLVNASLMYASARFSAFISAAMSETKEEYTKNTDKAIEFYVEEFEKMLKEHFKQYKSTFDKRNTPPYPH